MMQDHLRVAALPLEANMLEAPSVQMPGPEGLERFDDDPETRDERGLFALTGNPVATRPLNLLRAQLLKRCAKSGYRLIGVTSAAPGAGKSFVTCNLAAALSRIPGQRVLLFDLDMRRPSVSAYFDLRVEKGIDSWLKGDEDNLAAVGKRFGESGLTIFPTGRIGDVAGELLAGPRFSALTDALRAVPGDTIILCDLPPAFVSDDALTAVGRLDAYIHVIEEGVTPKRQVEELRNLMDPAPCVGAVLNRYAGSWTDSYSYGALRKYSQYYTKEE